MGVDAGEHGTTMVFYHGTSWEIAQTIEREGFRESSDGCLGPGVYVGREDKALRFAKDQERHGGDEGGLIKVEVRIRSPYFTKIDDRSWRLNGHDACRSHHTTRSDHMEWCVANPQSIRILSIRKVPLDGSQIPLPVETTEIQIEDVSTEQMRGDDVVGSSEADVEGLLTSNAVVMAPTQISLPRASDLDLAASGGASVERTWKCACGETNALYARCSACRKVMSDSMMQAAVAQAQNALSQPLDTDPLDAFGAAEAAVERISYRVGAAGGYAYARDAAADGRAHPAALQLTSLASPEKRVVVGMPQATKTPIP